jgi:uncharacterized protein YeaO (DUF488 family)
VLEPELVGPAQLRSSLKLAPAWSRARGGPKEHIGIVVKTKRWNEPIEPDDGCRLLVCRYRPRGVRRDDEKWDAWTPELGPSKELHAAVYGKQGSAISWDEYKVRYFREMEGQKFWIRALALRSHRGEHLTLLCSSACVDPDRCHRTLLLGLIDEARRHELSPAKSAPIARRRKAP